jgi:hypothetical protein
MHQALRGAVIIESRAEAPAESPPTDAAPPRVATVFSGRRRSRELLLAAGSVGFVVSWLLGIEWLLRWGSPGDHDRPQASLARLHRYSEAYGWEPRPRALASVEGQRTSINGRGLRGTEHPLARTSLRTRVLMVGDSIAFGYGVADEQTFAALLEARGYEVVNLAVPGYGTDQSLLRLAREGMAYSPDVVLLHFCLNNDFVDNASRTYFYDALHPKPYFTIDRDGLALHDQHLRLSRLNRLALWMHERSYLFSRLTGSPATGSHDRPGRKEAALRDGDAVRELTYRLIARAADVARKGGADFVLVVHSGRREFREGSPWFDALWNARSLRGIRQVDMGGQFLARGRRLQDLTLDPIGHLNPAGHREVAAVLAPILDEARARAGRVQ